MQPHLPGRHRPPGDGRQGPAPRLRQPRRAAAAALIAARQGGRPRPSATSATSSGARSTTTTRATSTSSRSPRPRRTARAAAGRDRRRRRARGVGLRDRRPRAAQHDVGLHGGRHLSRCCPSRSRPISPRSIEDEDRLAVVIEMTVGDDGAVEKADVFRAAVHNQAKLAYDAVGGLARRAAPRPPRSRGAPASSDNLRLQDRTADPCGRCATSTARSTSRRSRPRPCSTDDMLVDLRQTTKNRAELIEDFMVAANGVTARFLAGRGLPSLRRVLRTPERWDRIVAIARGPRRAAAARPGRAGARGVPRRGSARPTRCASPTSRSPSSRPWARASTSLELAGRRVHRPLRARGPRLLALDRAQPPLPRPRHAAAAEGRARRRAARLPARRARGARRALHRAGGRREQSRAPGPQVGGGAPARPAIGERFDAIVTGAGEKGTWVRIAAPAVEGKLVRGAHGLDVGDRVRVELVATTSSGASSTSCARGTDGSRPYRR